MFLTVDEKGYIIINRPNYYTFACLYTDAKTYYCSVRLNNSIRIDYPGNCLYTIRLTSQNLEHINRDINKDYYS